MSAVGSRTRAICARLFGERPTERFVDPLVADVQSEWAVEPSPAGRVKVRLRGLLYLFGLLPSLAARTEASSMLGWIWAAALAMAIGLVALARSFPSYARLQLVWLVVALVAAVTALRFAANLKSARAAWLLGAIAVVPPILAGSQWVNLGIPLSWAELTRPALLLGLVLLSGKQRLALAAVAWLCSAMVGDITTIVLTASAYLLMTGSSHWRLSASGAALALASLALAASRYPTIAELGGIGHTDAILTTIANDWGVVPAILATAASVAMVLSPLRGTHSPRARALAKGFSAAHLCQVLAHVGAALGLLPAIGASLPGIGYGGSALFGTAVTLATIAALDAKPSGQFMGRAGSALR